MASEWRIRECRPDEAQSVLALWRAAGALPSGTDDPEGLRVLMSAPSSALLVAESGGRLVGTVVAAFDGW